MSTCERYKNFDVSIYTRVYEVRQMSDLQWLADRYEVMRRSVKANKIYLETHRDLIVAEEATVRQAKAFFQERGMKVAGGITITVNESNRFETYCYTNPEHRQRLKEVVAYTASLFDEVILDDFFFTSCKCPLCVAAKGDRTWTEFRLQLMTDAARDLILEPARTANPNVKVVVKYPNWYEHFQGLGFNLDTQPKLFDGIYTGTETRDPVVGNQHLQPYLGYNVVRYFENIAPGRNGGGWVDPFGSRYSDRYAEQLWITLFAKAPECTLFDFRILDRFLRPEERAPWQTEGSSFNFDAATRSARLPDGSLRPDASIALVAGHAFSLVDSFIDQLGEPVGVPSYKPYHSSGEDFLHNYLGMIGLPIDLRPEFPAEAHTILLTEAAKTDPDIVAKIERQLMDGKWVVITSGLLRSLQDRGINRIVELQTSDRKASAQDFLIGWNGIYHSEKPITVPQIGYYTNDSWEEISCMAGVTGYPLLHSAQYGRGKLFILTIPEMFGDLYVLPPQVLNRIRAVVTRDLPVQVDGPSQISLFVYDNHKWIVQSFHDEAVEIRLMVDTSFTSIRDILSGEVYRGEPVIDWRGQPTGKMVVTVNLMPHSFRVFQGCA